MPNPRTLVWCPMRATKRMREHVAKANRAIDAHADAGFDHYAVIITPTLHSSMANLRMDMQQCVDRDNTLKAGKYSVLLAQAADHAIRSGR